MRDLDCWDALADPDRSESELVEWLGRLAEVPLGDRWPFFARVRPLLEHEAPAIRAAAFTAFAGAVGLGARQALVAGLDDEDEAVRRAVLVAFAFVGRADGLQWVHAVFHHREDVRLAALGAMPAKGGLPQWTLLPLLGDPVTLDRLEARLLEEGLAPESVVHLLQLLDGADVGRGLALRCFATVDWRHRLATVLQAIPHERDPSAAGDAPIDERLARWRDAPDDLDLLVGAVVDGVREGEPSAVAVLDRWLHDVAAGGIATEAERRLAVSLLLERSPPPEAVAIGLLVFPELVDRAQPAAIWPGMAPYARVVSGSITSVKRPGFIDRFPIPELDVDGLAGLVRLVGTGAVEAVLRHPDVPRSDLIDAIVANPAAGARFLAVPCSARRDRSAQRQLVVDVLDAKGADAAEFVAHAAIAIPRSQLGVLEARPSDWGGERALLDGIVHALVSLDAREAIRERRVRQLAELPWLLTTEVLELVLRDGRASPLVHRLLARTVRALGASVVAELPGDALERLIALDGEGMVPWAIQQELAAVLQHHGHSGVQEWAAAALAPMEVAMARLVGTSPGRRLSEAEVARIQAATPKQLASALAPALAGRVRGLVEALGERKPVPSVEAVLALLLSGDRLESVARLVEDYGDDSPAFWTELEQRAVARFAYDNEVGIGLAMWLWRWDRPFEVFVDWATAQPDDLALVLGRSLTLPSPRVRQRLWQAVRHLCGRWRWRSPAVLVTAATPRLQGAVMGVFAGASTKLSRGRSPGAWIAHEHDFAEVTRLAAGIVADLHRLTVDLSTHREAVEAVLADLPAKTVVELAPWLGMTPPPTDEVAEEPASVAPPKGVESLEDVATLIEIVTRGERGYAELAALRLLELGASGQRAIAEALAAHPGRNPGVICEAAALLTDPESLATLARVLADVGRPAIVRFHVALAAAEGHLLPGVDAVQIAADALATPLVEGDRAWLDGARFARWLATVPEDELGGHAERLADSPHFPVYRWSVAELVKRSDGAEVAPLRRFLRHGRSRVAKVRWEVAEALAVRGDSVGAPILAARRMEQVRGGIEPLVELPPRRVGEIVKAGVLASTPAPAAALLQAAVAPHVAQVERTLSALTVLRECDDEAVQRQALTHLDNRSTKSRLVSRLARLVVWGRDQARDLLDRDFGVQLIGGEALGYTRLEQDKVFVNPLPLIRGDRNGAAVLKGLLIHELGHHVYNATEEGLAVWKRAADHDLQRLHNLVCDEHLERNLRAMRPDYDRVLKRLAAWAFLHTRTEIHVLTLLERLGTSAERRIRAQLGVARKPGCVQVDMGQLFRQLEAERSSFARFVRALRMGLGNRHDDPLVEQGLALFGKGFRRLDNEGLWKVTLALSELFGDEVQLMNLVDLHETTTGGDGEAIAEGRGIGDDEVQERADELIRIRERPQGGGSGSGGGGGRDVINVGEELDFQRIEHVQVLAHDPVEHAKLARDVARPANQLRSALVDLGLATRTVKPRTRGHRIDRGRLLRAAIQRDPRILVSRVRVPANDLFVGVCVDCSGSMNGERMVRARKFATLLGEACRGLQSVDLRIFGFTDATLYDAGTASRCAAHALRAGGGNNDAAALHHVAGLARRSPRDAKLLVMISDGLPTECTSTSLVTLVKRLEREGMACAQVAVASIREPCFDHYVEVLGSDAGDVVRRFGRIVQGLVTAILRGR